MDQAPSPGKRVVGAAHSWITLGFALVFILKHPRLLLWSLLLVAATALATWGGYELATAGIDGLAGSFFLRAPAGEGLRHWLMLGGWYVLRFLFVVITRVVAFYLAFIVAYSVTAPGYVLLSAAAEDIYSGTRKHADSFSLSHALVDLWEGIKIGLVGILATVTALFANFIPLAGQVVAFLIYTFYSALMFVDYPSSRSRWSLRQKIAWIQRHHARAFRLGLLPALISLIPVLNIFIMALLFPVFTVHSTLNFIQVERAAS